MFAGLATAGLVLLPGVAWTDDARFYVPAAASYAHWLLRVFTFDGGALSREAIDAAFAVNHEHPPVGKLAIGLGWLVLHHLLGWADEVSACRVPIVLLWAWAGALVFRMTSRRVSPAAGLFAAAAFATLPRVLFDGHAETLDLPVTTFLVAAADAALTELETPSRRGAVWTVVAFALALGTKLNAPFLLAALGSYWLSTTPPRRDGTSVSFSSLPLGVLGMVTLSPLLAVATWPWLWHDTLARLRDYVAFHLHHYGILFYYGGVLHGDDVAPWTAPWVMTALTLPLPVLALALVGAARGAWRRSADTGGRLAWFALLVAATQIGSLSLPGVPVYGGVKLLLPAFPFVAVLAGCAFEAVRVELASLGARGRRLTVALALVALLPGGLGVAVYRGAWLSYYGELAGGLRGAVAAGYERQYYDLAYPKLREALAAALPRGGAVAFLPNAKEYGPYLARWRAAQELAPSLRLAPVEQADVLVLTHEERWREYPQLLAAHRRRPLLARFAVAGVALFSVYDLRSE